MGFVFIYFFFCLRFTQYITHYQYINKLSNHYKYSMKTVHLYLEELEHDQLTKKKGKQSWHDFVMSLLEK